MPAAMAQNQARAVLGLGKQAAQSVDTLQHTKAKSFFKEVGRTLVCGPGIGTAVDPKDAPCHGRCRRAAADATRVLPTASAALPPPLPPPLQVCRCLPWVAKNYRLEELTTVPVLRRNLATLFRKYADVRSPEAIDLLVYKGREELEVGASNAATAAAAVPLSSRRSASANAV